MVYKQTARITATGVVTGLGATVNAEKERRCFSFYAILAKGVGGIPTALVAALEVSLNDGANWTSIQAITQANDGAVLFIVDKPAVQVRVNVSALTLAPATAVDFYLLMATYPVTQ